LRNKQQGGELYLHLRHQAKPYRKRYGATTNSSRGIPNRVDIDERPASVNNRGKIGDWEGDTIIGKGHKGAIVTLDERKSKLRLAWPLKGKFAEETKEGIVRLLEPFKAFVNTITFDNGKEFANHEQIAKRLKCDFYFALILAPLFIPSLRSSSVPILICPNVSKVSQISNILANPVTHAADLRQNGILVHTDRFLFAISPP
jgi:IS30 family transposase